MTAASIDRPAREGGGLEELTRGHFVHLDTGHWVTPPDISSDAQLLLAAPEGSLPYSLLDPYAFERLCYHLLLARGQGVPRFWGRRGQAQQGIDLILSDGASSVVYQCKHTATFSARHLADAVYKFRDDWLTRPQLGRPTTFVLCTSATLDRTTDWQESKVKLSTEINVAIEEWDRHTLDGWLKTEPGIVGELFGERVADLFCSRGRGWNVGLFKPLVPGAEMRHIDHYLTLVAQNRLVRDERDEATFQHILSEGRFVLLGGLAGAGKTMTALDLAVAFEGGAWRVFYLRADASKDIDKIVAGIVSFSFRPTIFVIDDCHQAFEEVQYIVQRLSRVNTPFKLVLTARTPPDGIDFIEPAGTAFIEDMRRNGQVIEIAADESRYRAIFRKRRPEWSRPPIKRIMDWTGRDLAILDLVLDATTSADFKDAQKLDDLFPKIRHLIFDAHRASAPNLKRLAAAAQFDVAVPEEVFPYPFEAKRNDAAVARFVVAGGEPSALFFHHPSAAELVYRLLSWADGDPNIAQTCAHHCVELVDKTAAKLGRQWTLDKLLDPLVKTRLNLYDDSEIKSLMLSDARIVSLIDEDVLTHPLLVSIAAFLCRNVNPRPPYASRLASYLETVATNPTPAAQIGLIGMFLRTLALSDPLAHAQLEKRLGSAAIARLITEAGTLVELLGVLRNSTEGFAVDLLQTFEPCAIAALVAATVREKKSIGTLSLALRALGTRPLSGESGRTQLHLFEERIGSAAMARLIAEAGTLIELLGILQVSTRSFAADLLLAFEPIQLTALVDATIEKKKSIGTIHLSLRELGMRSLSGGARRTQLHLFEERLGSAAMARLIAEAGTLVGLLRVLEHSSDGFAEDLLRAFDPVQVARLVDAMIAREKASIRTLHLALRELNTRPLSGEPGRTQLNLLEEALGEAVMARLITEAGTLIELLKIVAYSTEGFAASLLRAFDSRQFAALVEATVREKKSIGTLSLALRELRTRPLSGEPGRTQLHLFEERIGSAAMARLIAEAGTLIELLGILKGSTDDFAVALLLAFEPIQLTALVDATIENKKSIGTLDLSLREFGMRSLSGEPGRTQLHLFEERLGSVAMARLVAEAGSMGELLRILQRSTDGFAAELLQAFKPVQLRALVDATIKAKKSIGTFSLALHKLAKRPLSGRPGLTQLHLFEERLGASNFWRLVRQAGNLNFLAYFVDALTPAFQKTVLAAGNAPTLSGWTALAARGSLYDLARFAADSLHLLPAKTAERFGSAVAATALDLAKTGTWESVGTALAKAEEIADASILKTIRTAALQRIDMVTIDDLVAQDYGETASALWTLWNCRPGLRPALATALWQLLPHETSWPRDESLLRKGSLLLRLARSPQVHEADALRLLRAYSPLALDVHLHPQSARHQALFLWNIFALWMERGKPFAEPFRDLQRPEIWGRFVRIVEKRQKWPRNEDKLDTFMLAGALAFLVPDLRPRIAGLIGGKILGVKYLAIIGDDLTFVPAFFAHQGMALSDTEQAVLTKPRADLLLEKAKASEETGPALEHLCHWLRSLTAESSSVAAIHR